MLSPQSGKYPKKSCENMGKDWRSYRKMCACMQGNWHWKSTPQWSASTESLVQRSNLQMLGHPASWDFMLPNLEQQQKGVGQILPVPQPYLFILPLLMKNFNFPVLTFPCLKVLSGRCWHGKQKSLDFPLVG